MIRIVLAVALLLLAQRRRRASAPRRSRQGAGADRQAARRDQLRQRRAGAEGRGRRPRASPPTCRASWRSASACRSSSSPSRRPARRSRPRKRTHRRDVHRDRAGARRRDRIHAALCADRGHLPGAEGLAARETVADVDQPGMRIAVGENSAYDLYLTRTLKHAKLLRAPTGGCCKKIDLFRAEKLDAVGGRAPAAGRVREAARGRARDGRAVPANPPGDGHAEGPRSPRAAYLRTLHRGDEGERLRRRGAEAQQSTGRAGRARRRMR